MFIDSVIVKKSQLLSSLNIPDEAGSVESYNKFFNTTGQANAVVYVNQLRNKCVFSKFADGGWDLYSSEMIGGKWSRPIPLKGLDILGDDVDINWPFMLADGNTLYFAAKGEESIGGFGFDHHAGSGDLAIRREPREGADGPGGGHERGGCAEAQYG